MGEIMNLRNANSYVIGLDLGTGSTGWAIVDEAGRIVHVKGQPAWGARLYPNAEQAGDRRIKRSQRRRYTRRKQRIEILKSLFCEEINKTDPDFFARLQWSFMRPDDERSLRNTDNPNPLFNNSDFTEHAYCNQFPTVWHLRRYLMETDEKADIRLVYLALENIVKRRGNFLREDQPNLRANNAKMDEACSTLREAILKRASLLDINGVSLNENALIKVLSSNLRRADIVDLLVKDVIAIPEQPKMAKAIAQACVGYRTEFTVALAIEKEGDAITKFSFADDDKVDEFNCPDDALPLFEAMQHLYSAYVLHGLLLYSPGNTISYQFSKQYSIHAEDLKKTKELIKQYRPESYNSFFRGPKFSNGDYDFNKIDTPSYTAYVLGEKLCNRKGCSHEELIKKIRDLLNPAEIPGLANDPLYISVADRLTSDSSDFLAKQRRRENGAIPFQLHLEEAERIIQNQGRFYPFLLDNADQIEKLISSRIPYYVGPLNTQKDPGGPFTSNAADINRKFAWSERKPGTENEKVYPWNIEDVINKDATAEKFIRRMTGTCSYLYGEPVLPKHSLLYEEFCVLNELNGVRWRWKASKWDRINDRSDREKIIEEIFKKRLNVPYRALEEWMRRNHGFENVEITGGQKENGFASSLSSHHYFCRVLDVDDLDLSQYRMVEELILWCTLFEDRNILQHKIEQTYGNILTEGQIEAISKKHFTGWGKLSEKLLCNTIADTQNWGEVSIMDVLRLGNPINHGKAAIFQEIVTDADLGFQKLIENENEDTVSLMTIDEMPGSPALRRTVNQALRIVDEIVGIAGHPPSAICIEETRDNDESKRGIRSKTREKNLRNAYAQFMNELSSEMARAEKGNNNQLLKELQEYQKKLDSERLMLYFSQRGKSLYSDTPLDISRLNEYEVDHIIPRSYIKDDSLENKALVLKSENQSKLDSLLINENIRRKMQSTWKALHSAKLIGDKKFRNLMRDEISDKAFKGFINRQLVETGQVVKFVRQMLEQRYPQTDIKTVRASVSSGIRDNANFPKCREANDYHHAQDAYLACQVTRFMDTCYPSWQDPIQLQYIKRQFSIMAREGLKSGRLPGRSGFVADMFVRVHADKETGEIIWDAEKELSAMRRELYCKQCYITRMLEIRTGAFWDENPISPRDQKNGKALSVPLKNNAITGYLPPEMYGGYNNARQAFFFAFTATDKNEKKRYFFEGLPIHLAERYIKNRDLLDSYALEIAEKAECHDVVIFRRCIPYQQVFILDGTRYILAGKTGLKNIILPAVENAFSADDIHDIKTILDGEHVSDEVAYRVFNVLCDAFSHNCAPKKQTLKLDSYKDSFVSATPESKQVVLKNLLSLFTGAKPKASADISALGGTKQAGQIARSIASSLKNVCWVDQSVTGIFENKTSMGNLTDGI